MNLKHSTIELSETQAEHLQYSRPKWYTVEVQPPRTEKDVPATVEGFVRGILEIQNKWLGLRNTSPTAAYEIRRPKPNQLRFLFAAPTKRLVRKIRTQLSDEIPGVGFETGVSGLPVTPGDTVGGGLLTTGESSYYPFETSHESPASNAITALLHRHAMRDTKIVIQVLFRPVAGNPLGNWWWRKRAVNQRNYLKREREKLWGTTKPTHREKRQANAIDYKTGNARFWTSIRFLIIGAGDHTPSRVKELAGGFNRYENPESDQYFNTVTLTPYRKKRLLSYAEAVADRKFRGWSQKFRATTSELAALLALPSRRQDNITPSQP